MPILQQNDAAAVARYTEFVTRSPWGNLMQDAAGPMLKRVGSASRSIWSRMERSPPP